MRVLVFFVVIILLFSCNTNNKAGVKLLPALRIVNFDTSLKKSIDSWFYKGQLFSGYMIQVEKDGRTAYELPIINGKENGMAKGIYNSGEKLMERSFINGKREGIFKQWWPNGNYRYLFNFKNDLYQGSQYIYFPDGKKRQVSNYVSGELDGLQRIWNEEGRLISNYTYRNKKLYGIINVKSCIPNEH